MGWALRKEPGGHSAAVLVTQVRAKVEARYQAWVEGHAKVIGDVRSGNGPVHEYELHHNLGPRAPVEKEDA